MIRRELLDSSSLALNGGGLGLVTAIGLTELLSGDGLARAPTYMQPDLFVTGALPREDRSVRKSNPAANPNPATQIIGANLASNSAEALKIWSSGIRPLHVHSPNQGAQE